MGWWVVDGGGQRDPEAERCQLQQKASEVESRDAEPKPESSKAESGKGQPEARKVSKSPKSQRVEGTFEESLSLSEAHFGVLGCPC